MEAFFMQIATVKATITRGHTYLNSTRNMATGHLVTTAQET